MIRFLSLLIFFLTVRLDNSFRNAYLLGTVINKSERHNWALNSLQIDRVPQKFSRIEISKDKDLSVNNKKSIFTKRDPCLRIENNKAVVLENKQDAIRTKSDVILSEISNLYLIESNENNNGIFLSFNFSIASEQHDIQLGKLPTGCKMVAYSRIKRWWMAPNFVNNANDIPVETQLLLIEITSTGYTSDKSYVLVAPLIDFGRGFRVTLFGKEGGAANGRLSARVESGDRSIKSNIVDNAIYIGTGNDPYELTQRSYREISEKMGTFRTKNEKVAPVSLDSFGWCSWDAFYSSVDSEKVEQGIDSLISAGVPPKFVIIDDGWQQTATITEGNKQPTKMKGNDSKKIEPQDGELSGAQIDGALASEKIMENENPLLALGAKFVSSFYVNMVEKGDVDSWGVRLWSKISQTVLKEKLIEFFNSQTDFSKRLTSWKANSKFEDASTGKTLKKFVSNLKTNKGISHVYVWHALSGYWGGVSEDLNHDLTLALNGIELEPESLQSKVHYVDSLPVSPQIVQQRRGVLSRIWRKNRNEKFQENLPKINVDNILEQIHLNISQMHLNISQMHLNISFVPNEIGESLMKAVNSLNSAVKRTFQKPTPHLLRVEPALLWDPASLAGVGSVAKGKLDIMYKKMHTYLAEAGVDGVKCDAQSGIGSFGEGNGGGSAIARACVQALEKSAKIAFQKPINFISTPQLSTSTRTGGGSGYIQRVRMLFSRILQRITKFFRNSLRVWILGKSRMNLLQQATSTVVETPNEGTFLEGCMCHSTENLYSYYDTPVARASDDFYPKDIPAQSVHLVSCAYNSVMLGEIATPDWDMFHSHHACADLHAAARAVSGGPVYVSDAPNCHDTDLLQKLVLPDGHILRAALPGRPTVDCLFADVMSDGVSALKVWSSNKVSGVVGVFNVQGAKWDRKLRRYVQHKADPCNVKSTVYPRDIPVAALFNGISGDFSSWSGSKSSRFENYDGYEGYIAWSAAKKSFTLLKSEDSGLDMILAPRDWDVVSLSKVWRASSCLQAAKPSNPISPIGRIASIPFTAAAILARGLSRGTTAVVGNAHGLKLDASMNQESHNGSHMDADIGSELRDFAFSFLADEEPEPSITWSPIGLTNMLNAGGAIVSIDDTPQVHDLFTRSSLHEARKRATAAFTARGVGTLAVYSNQCPVSIWVDGQEVEFDFEAPYTIGKASHPVDSPPKVIEGLITFQLKQADMLDNTSDSNPKASSLSLKNIVILWQSNIRLPAKL